MSKKKPKGHKGDREPELPKFGGFKPLAAGLGDLKAKIDAEQRAKEEADRARIAAGKRPAPAPAPRPAPARVEKRTAESDRDDELTFHRMMSGVVPLENRGSRVPVAGGARVEPGKLKPADLRERAREEAVAVLDHLHHLVDDVVRFEVTDDGKRVEGRRVDVPPSLLRDLRRGALPIDGRLDLHGLGAEVARERLLEFLRAQRTRGERCVLVIHGKGEHSVAPGGVLRGEIAAWLSQGRAREHVAAFATAHDEDGGEGAVYVALRR
ncbi:MAG: Smr/MutS family protein [Labilithrix sp.]|nr:Smr/MutS family protein [Labilithrix sp.]